ncbi:MAG: xylose isomerase [Candidatus Thermofonsia Clade 1 bacterium]|uniref:Xylose isomerase n=1 Tax=Candidatus Thermofonsia Clade 1 bacterium TaxID=2364210 RepID=A0A2M8NYJ0_9CHLR|nr:MAG: xylose isomerase [Candidatus Thermofonsia Clade 1 bacterium]
MSAAAEPPVSRFGTPFRVGSTSYVYPDDILPNVERLAADGDVGDIELILFEVDDGATNLPDPRTVERLGALAAQHNLTYSVHLPLDLALAADGSAQHQSLFKAERVIRLTQPLMPSAYVFHLDGQGVEAPNWVDRALRALEIVISWVGEPSLLAVENLETWSPHYLDPILARLPISRTTDIGHLWKMGVEPLSVLEAWLPRTRVIHLHGVGERDHKSLALMSADQLDPVIAALLRAPYRGVLTLEVFETSDFFSSRAALLESVARVQAWAT